MSYEKKIILKGNIKTIYIEHHSRVNMNRFHDPNFEATDVTYYIIYHWNANFKNQCLSQYVAGLLAKISWFIKRGKDMTSPVGTHHSLVQQFWLFTTISSTNTMQKRFKWFTFLQKYFWAGRFGHIINSSSWKLHNVYSEINTNLCCKTVLKLNTQKFWFSRETWMTLSHLSE